MTKKFRITYAIDVTLTEAEIWPDGDAPAKPTAEDVARLIRKAGGFPKIIEEWNLDPKARTVGFSVSANVGSDPCNFDVIEET